MRMQRILLVVLLLVAWGCAPAVPVHAANSVLDTLHKADEQGTSGNEAPVVPPASVSAPTGTAADRPVSVTLTPAQIEQIVQAIIKAILQNFGIGSSGIVIKLPPAAEPPVVAKPPVVEPVEPASDGDENVAFAASSSMGLRATMKAKFGIDCADGDRAKWNEAQYDRANKVLAALPAGFRKYTKKIVRDKFYRSSSVLGYVRMGIPTVHILDSACSENTFQGTIVHEMAHCFQASNARITTLWQTTFWPKGRAARPKSSSVSSYGNTQPIEDMAESVRVYFQSGSSMKARYPDRYAFIKKYVMSGKEF